MTATLTLDSVSTLHRKLVGKSGQRKRVRVWLSRRFRVCVEQWQSCFFCRCEPPLPGLSRVVEKGCSTWPQVQKVLALLLREEFPLTLKE